MAKKAQQDILVTVLLILIALIAVSLVVALIMRSVRTSTSEAQNRVDCQSQEIFIKEITTVTNGGSSVNATIIAERGSRGGDIALKEIKVYVDDKTNTTMPVPEILSTSSITINFITLGKKVTIYPVLNNSGFICDTGDSKIIS